MLIEQLIRDREELKEMEEQVAAAKARAAGEAAYKQATAVLGVLADEIEIVAGGMTTVKNLSGTYQSCRKGFC
jgi:hypothetical protein